MQIRLARFNSNLLVLLVAAVSLGAVVMGCQSHERKRNKQLALFRVHLEGNRDASGRSQPVPIYRTHPILINVYKMPELIEENVEEAKVTESMGGFTLDVQFNRDGTLILDQLTGANRGKHLAIFCSFGVPNEKGLQTNRWLAAPMITQHITNGFLSFTPDATRAEAEDIAIGLNNVAKKVESFGKFW